MQTETEECLFNSTSSWRFAVCEHWDFLHAIDDKLCGQNNRNAFHCVASNKKTQFCSTVALTAQDNTKVTVFSVYSRVRLGEGMHFHQYWSREIQDVCVC